MTGSVVCYGEVLLRLSAPGQELLLQSPALRVDVGGAEANVAVSLARFGHRTQVVTLLPDNPLGRGARDELRRHGAGTAHVRFGPGRMGLYFLSFGTGHRPSRIVYDRSGSAFATGAHDAIDWPAVLDGAAWLHLSGITPALGAGPAAAATAAARCARERGVKVSFDCNYRSQLWADSREAARALRELLELADLAFGDDRVLAMVLQEDFSHLPDRQRFEHASARALELIPQLQCIATMIREEHDVDRHDIAASMAMRGHVCSTRTYRLQRIVDRIGTGDAFAAGLLHGILQGLAPQEIVEFALAAACLKHSIPGDFNLAGVADVEHLLSGRGYAVRR